MLARRQVGCLQFLPLTRDLGRDILFIRPPPMLLNKRRNFSLTICEIGDFESSPVLFNATLSESRLMK